MSRVLYLTQINSSKNYGMFDADGSPYKFLVANSVTLNRIHRLICPSEVVEMDFP